METPTLALCRQLLYNVRAKAGNKVARIALVESTRQALRLSESFVRVRSTFLLEPTFRSTTSRPQCFNTCSWALSTQLSTCFTEGMFSYHMVHFWLLFLDQCLKYRASRAISAHLHSRKPITDVQPSTSASARNNAPKSLKARHRSTILDLPIGAAARHSQIRAAYAPYCPWPSLTRVSQC
jgi:hypothetical protein